MGVQMEIRLKKKKEEWSICLVQGLALGPRLAGGCTGDRCPLGGHLCKAQGDAHHANSSPEVRNQIKRFSYSLSPLPVWGQSLGTKVVRRSSQRVFKSFVWFTCNSQQKAMEKIKFSCSWPLSSGLIHKPNCIGSITLLGVILLYIYMPQAMCNRMDHTQKVRATAARVSKDGSILQTGMCRDGTDLTSEGRGTKGI